VKLFKTRQRLARQNSEKLDSTKFARFAARPVLGIVSTLPSNVASKKTPCHSARLFMLAYYTRYNIRYLYFRTLKYFDILNFDFLSLFLSHNFIDFIDFLTRSVQTREGRVQSIFIHENFSTSKHPHSLYFIFF